MWIFARQGFISIVADRDNPGSLLVRGRVKGDIEAVIPSAEGLVHYTPTHDYAYRASLPSAAVAKDMRAEIMAITYDNFKATQGGDLQRAAAYHKVWEIMHSFQKWCKIFRPNTENKHASNPDRPGNRKRKRG